MSTRINVNVGGFDALNLREQAAINISNNRARKEERDRKKRITEAARARRLLVNPNRIQYLGNTQSLVPKPRDEYVPRRMTANFGDVCHFWWFIDSQEVLNDGYVAEGNDSFSEVEGYGREIQFVTQRRIGIKRTSKIFCGNGSKYIEIEHGIPEGQRLSTSSGSGSLPVQTSPGYGYHNVTTLPIGGGSCLIIFTASCVLTSITIPASGNQFGPAPFGWNYLSLLTYTLNQEHYLTRRIFVCSNEDIREIEIPSAFIPLLDEIHAPVAVESPYYSALYAGYLNQYNGAPYNRVGFVINVFYKPSEYSTGDHPGGIYSVGGVHFDAYAGSVSSITPDIFRDLVERSHTTNWQNSIGNLVKPLPSNIRYLVEDWSQGAYSLSSEWWDADQRYELFNLGDPFCYGIWKKPGEEPYDLSIPSLYDKYPRGTLQMAEERPILEEPAYVTGDYYGYPSTQKQYFISVWDWGDPKYCREICLALGFAEDDLKP